MAERIESARRAAAAAAPAPAAAASAPAPGIYYAAPTQPPPAAPAPLPSPKRTKKTPSLRTTSVGTCPLAPAAPRGGARPKRTKAVPGLLVAIHESGGGVSSYWLPTKAKLSTIFNSHAIGKRVPVDSLTFFLDGSPISGDQTPEDLGLEPGDRIDCKRA